MIDDTIDFARVTSNKDVNTDETKINPFRILVADDDRSVLKLYRNVLSRVNTNPYGSGDNPKPKGNPYCPTPLNLTPQSFDIVTCQQADEAVDAVKNSLECGRPFSVVFTDIRMPPGPDGIWAAEHIRALDPNIEIVMVTGHTDIHPRDISSRVPPVHKLLYIQKPFQSREIFQFASSLSMKWNLERELKKVHKESEKKSKILSHTLKKMEDKEEDLIQHKSNLEKLNKEMIETNRALSVLAGNIVKNKEILEKKIYETCTAKILPIIKDLKSNKNCQRIMADLDVLETNLNSLFSGSNNHHEIINILTDQEMRVVALIKRGLTSQKISNLLCISEDTVKTHRKNIRKKLKIQNSNINLFSYLKSNMPSDLIRESQAPFHGPDL